MTKQYYCVTVYHSITSPVDTSKTLMVELAVRMTCYGVPSLYKLGPKRSANRQQLPSSHNIHIWDPSPTVRPSTCTQHLTFTQTHWHAQVLTTFLLHSCARRQESINNPFEWDPAGFSVWNFEHPAIVLDSTTNICSYPKWSVALTTLRTQRQYVSVSLSADQGF